MAAKLQAIRFVVNPFRYMCRASSPLSTCRFWSKLNPGRSGYPSWPGKANLVGPITRNPPFASSVAQASLSIEGSDSNSQVRKRLVELVRW
ncbi:hypothetical protein JG688_00001493 [Phytophthora aleatoria]|uniref:Uncharacterized protein n=1 Tax=Phytophthora aleatoria TaxID=2496075 RepID=A0A8J5JBJ4_9STRA|nr:hypothetical protein JG688_00001493 [Phytophthora aleatoria]